MGSISALAGFLNCITSATGANPMQNACQQDQTAAAGDFGPDFKLDFSQESLTQNGQSETMDQVQLSGYTASGQSFVIGAGTIAPVAGSGASATQSTFSSLVNKIEVTLHSGTTAPDVEILVSVPNASIGTPNTASADDFTSDQNSSILQTFEQMLTALDADLSGTASASTDANNAASGTSGATAGTANTVS